jgi:hypothetical protein
VGEEGFPPDKGARGSGRGSEEERRIILFLCEHSLPLFSTLPEKNYSFV